MKKSFTKRYLKNKYTIGGAIILVIVLYFVFRPSKGPANLETAVAAVGNIYERVSVTGQVMPIAKADLGFEKGGVVTSIAVKVGDHVKKGDPIAFLDSAGDAANLAAAQAKLADISRGLRPQELDVQQSKVDAAQVALANAKQDALNASRVGYVQAQSALTNYTDSLFTNPQSANPVINVPTESYTSQTSINLERLSATTILTNWSNALNSATSSDSASSIVAAALGYLNNLKSFMNDLNVIVSNLSPGNSGLLQTEISADVSNMNLALSTMNQAMTSVSSADTALRNAMAAYQSASNDFILASAGNSTQSIAAQAASVAAAKAELNKDRLVSPQDGIMTRADPSVGEYVAPGQAAFAVQSDGQYKIEAHVAEADIAKVAVGDMSSTTLDAYGQYVDFKSQVVSIDPAETVLEGVPTYKVTLVFSAPDPRIRSGMTANLDILTQEHDDVLSVPTRAIIDQNGSKSVRLLNADGKTFTSVPVAVGLKGSDGTTEIVSGLSAGQKVVTYIQ
jgi:RND family efflux transporter MFP subunit